MSLPTIAHADVAYNQWGRVEITMHEGWVFWDRADYFDDNGNIIDPAPENIIYSRYGVYAPDTDFDYRIVVVAESDVSADQIYGTVTPPTVTA